MKSVVEWDEQYILNLPPGEHDWVEFKGAQSLDFSLPGINENKVLNELSKQISAFSNSGGGTIVYGIEDFPSGSNRRIDNGGISLNLKGRSTKEWLEDIIPNIVEFPLDKFNVYVILSNPPKSDIEKDKGIFLIYIPDSENAPHQATDKKYYARVGGKSRPIGHRMVLDIFGRFKFPKISLQFWKELDKESNLVNLLAFCRNTGRVFANYVNGFIFLPICLKPIDNKSKEIINEKEYANIYFSNIHKDLINFKPGLPSFSVPFGRSTQGIPSTSYYVTRYDPVLPQLGFYKIIDLEIREEEIKNLSEEIIYWEVFSDNAPVVKGSIKLEDIPWNKDK